MSQNITTRCALRQYDKEDSSPVTIRTNPQAVHLSALVQASTTMQHIDEMFLWLAQTLVQHYDIQVAQFWACAVSITGQTAVQPRMVVCQDDSFPLRVVSNAHTAEAAQRLLRERRGADVQPVDGNFSPHQVKLFKRYGLLHWLSTFIRDDALLPPTSHPSGAGQVPAPLELATLMFFRRPPSLHLVTVTNLWVKQAILIAKKSGLLLTSTLPASQPVTRPSVSLDRLVPHRFQEEDGMRLHSPFASAPSIEGREARLLYRAIDGRKNVEELAHLTALESDEIFAALSTLLSQQKIILCDEAGVPVEGFQQNPGAS